MWYERAAFTRAVIHHCVALLAPIPQVFYVWIFWGSIQHQVDSPCWRTPSPRGQLDCLATFELWQECSAVRMRGQTQEVQTVLLRLFYSSNLASTITSDYSNGWGIFMSTDRVVVNTAMVLMWQRRRRRRRR